MSDAPDNIEITPDPALANNTAEDVGAMLDALRNPEPEPEPAPAPEPEPPAEPQAAEPAAEEPPPEPPAEAPPEPTEDPLEDLRLSLQEEGLRRERLEAQLAHEKLLREQSNTRAGVLKTLTTDLLRDGHTPPADRPEYEDEDSPVKRELQAMQQELASWRDEANTRVSQETLQAFVNSTPDLAKDTPESQALLMEMKDHVTEGTREHSELLKSGNPKLVRETTRLILKTAYVEAKAARIAQARASAKEKRAQQFADRARTVSSAAISGTGSAPPARPKPKTTSDLSADEAGKALDAMLR